MKKIRLHRICWELAAALSFALAGGGSCSSELPLDSLAKEGSPVKVVAEIEPPAAATKATAADNAYDRSSFIAGDKIRVTKMYGGNRTVVDYTYSGTVWSTTSATPLTLQAGATYQAIFPANNQTAILPDQSTKENYIKSNRLETPLVNAPLTEVLEFTTGKSSAFSHLYAKLTLVFTGANALSGAASLAVSAPGLCTGAAAAEQIVLYRPSAAEYTWCGIVYPGQKTLKVTFATGNVSYPVELPDCQLEVGKNYKFTLHLRNDRLVPVANEITDWKDETAYTGGFN